MLIAFDVRCYCRYTNLESIFYIEIIGSVERIRRDLT